jgi:hypothetical protein
MAISPLNKELVKTNSKAGESKELYETLLVFFIGIAIAYGLLERLF